MFDKAAAERINVLQESCPDLEDCDRDGERDEDCGIGSQSSQEGSGIGSAVSVSSLWDSLQSVSANDDGEKRQVALTAAPHLTLLRTSGSWTGIISLLPVGCHHGRHEDLQRIRAAEDQVAVR